MGFQIAWLTVVLIYVGYRIVGKLDEILTELRRQVRVG